jgi:DNA repair protein RadC
VKLSPTATQSASRISGHRQVRPHPSGNLEPSSADVQVTRQLKAAGEALTIPVVESVVGLDGWYTSLAERRLT